MVSSLTGRKILSDICCSAQRSFLGWLIDIDYARLSRAFVDDTNKYQSHPIDIIPKKNNVDFLESPCEYTTQDDGVSKDFVMRTKTGKDRVMMLWERPISVFSHFYRNILLENSDFVYTHRPCHSGTNCKGLNGWSGCRKICP